MLKGRIFVCRESGLTCALLGWRLGGIITGLVWEIDDGSGGQIGRLLRSLCVGATDFREAGKDRGLWADSDSLTSFMTS